MSLPTDFQAMPKPKEMALGGGIEGATRTTREMATWVPLMGPGDALVNPIKQMADARSRDVVLNDGYMLGAINTHRDSIVGNQYRLNAVPNYKLLGATEEWSEEFQQWVESTFNMISDSPACWLHAGGTLTLTGMIRLAIAQFMVAGEVLGSAEWKRGAARPFNTAFQLISPDRLSNPDLRMDGKYLRRGLVLNSWGEPTDGWIRQGHPNDYLSYDYAEAFQWKKVPIRLPWGRLQLLHIHDAIQPDQARGISDMVSVLKQVKMTKSFQDITLQNAVVNASYAATIESELPPEMIAAAMGQGQQVGFAGVAFDYMSAVTQYLAGAGAIQIDGAKIPHLFPNSKLNMKPMGTPGGVGTTFEESMLRHIAAGLGLSYEAFSKDYSKVNYSSARAGQNETHRFMQARKKLIADRTASEIYTLWFEEQISAGNVPLIPGKSKNDMINLFYTPMMKEAFTLCGWIGAGRGQIDEMKETQSAAIRIKAGLSTYEIETARLGYDWRDVFKQQSREKKLMDSLGLMFSMDASKVGGNMAQQTVRGERNDNATEQETDEDTEL